MKKFISLLLLSVILLFSLSTFSACSTESSETVTLYVYNWGEYISDGSDNTLNVNDAFEKWYNSTIGKDKGIRVEVNYSTFSSNEEMYAKVTSGAVNYDVIVPSDYMIQRLIKEKELHELNYENIPNMENILDNFKGENAYYDPNNKYSVPYLYGVIGIIYNTDMIPADEENIGSWALMWDEDYKDEGILQFNNSRDAFGTAMYYQGIDVNEATDEEWRNALDDPNKGLKRQKEFVQGYVMDEIYNKMENGSAAIAAYYAGDFLTMHENNPSLDFYYPEEGTNLYVDAMCIPKSSKNTDIAEAYLNFMLSEEAAIANAEYTYYASPNRLVVESPEYIDYMENISEEFNAYEKMYPEISDTTSENYVYVTSYKNLTEDKLVLLNGLWEELKADIDIGVWIYVSCGIIIAILLLMFVLHVIKKKKMKKLYENA